LVFSTYLNGSGIDAEDRIFIGKCACGRCRRVTCMPVDKTATPWQEGLPDNGPGSVAAGLPGRQQFGEVRHRLCDQASPAGALVWSTFYGSPSTAGGNQTVSAIALRCQQECLHRRQREWTGRFSAEQWLPGLRRRGCLRHRVEKRRLTGVVRLLLRRCEQRVSDGNGVDARENIYVAGYTAGGLPLDSAYQSTNGGGYNEGFFAKISGPARSATLAGR